MRFGTAVSLLACLAACGGVGGDGSPSGGDDTGGSSSSPGTGILTAGEYDDNKNFDHLRTQLDGMFQTEVDKAPLDISDRVVVTVTAGDQPVPNARVAVRTGEAELFHALTGTDGRLILFPFRDGLTNVPDASIEVTSAAGTQTFPLPDGGDWNLALPGVAVAPVGGIDVAFVVDATGSMGDEIAFLKAELSGIAERIATDFPTTVRRFALIVYRDFGDEYVVRKFSFTPKLADFLADLDGQDAGGGGDYPEAASQALDEAMKLAWSDGNVARLVFHVADAPSHDTDFGKHLETAITARELGIRIFPVAASGVSVEAEYLMRMSALATGGRYLFLTDDSGVGNPHEAPHIPCYQVQRLEDLMGRVIASELAGAYIPAPADEVIRTVGNYDAGTCRED